MCLYNFLKLTDSKIIRYTELVNSIWIRGNFSWLEVFEGFLTESGKTEIAD